MCPGSSYPILYTYLKYKHIFFFISISGRIRNIFQLSWIRILIPAENLWSVFINFFLTLKLVCADKSSRMYQNLLYVQEVVTPFYIVSCFIKWVTTSWTYSIFMLKKNILPKSVLSGVFGEGLIYIYKLLMSLFFVIVFNLKLLSFFSLFFH